MASISASNGILQFTPKDANSYFYETFPCTQASSQGYGGLQFTLTYPAGTDFTLELQSKTNCNAANYTSEWFAISGLTGTQQVVTLDLGVYETSNLNAISGLVYASFSKVGAYTLSDLKFVCRNLEARAIQGEFATPGRTLEESPPPRVYCRSFANYARATRFAA